eukprot:Em1001g1a
MSYPALGLSDVLCLPAKKKVSIGNRFLKNCSTIKPLKPIIASGFMSRGQRKIGTEVAWNLATKVFAYLGLPKILQSDNGREFTSTLINKLVKNWPGYMTIVNGRPRHPQSQGLVERGDAKLCFGQPPHSSPFPGATTGSVMEAVSDILAADTCEVEEVGDISETDDVEEEVTDISDSDSNAGMAGCTKEDVSATGIFEKGGSEDSDSDTKQNETDTAQCISEKEKHMSEVLYSHQDMELFNHIKAEID